MNKLLNRIRIKIYYFLLRFKRGIDAGIYITWKCNFQCSYCPIVKNCEQEWTCDEFLDLIKTFNLKIRQIAISGGEPTLKLGIVDFVNKLLDMGFFVCVFTNLSKPKILNKIRMSPKFIIKSNLHKDFITPIKFLKNADIVRHCIQLGEFKELGNTSDKLRQVYLVKNYELEKFYHRDKNFLCLTPSGVLVTSCYEACIEGELISKII